MGVAHGVGEALLSKVLRDVIDELAVCDADEQVVADVGVFLGCGKARIKVFGDLGGTLGGRSSTSPSAAGL